MDLKKLREPFLPDELEWKPLSVGKTGGKFWVRALAYVTNRAIMDRLDEVCGPEGWKNEFCKGPEGGILCGLSIKVGDEWVEKWDGSENSDIEAVKGGLSGSMKRSAVQWGIGRYLYDLEENFGEISQGGIYSAKTKEGEWFNWNPPNLPKWAIPGASEAKTRGNLPPPGDPPHDPEAKPSQTHREAVGEYVKSHLDKLSDQQKDTLRSAYSAAGTTDAMLDSVKSACDGFLVENEARAL